MTTKPSETKTILDFDTLESLKKYYEDVSDEEDDDEYDDDDDVDHRSDIENDLVFDPEEDMYLEGYDSDQILVCFLLWQCNINSL
jgi:hypothetical protein